MIGAGGFTGAVNHAGKQRESMIGAGGITGAVDHAGKRRESVFVSLA
jgi:hypothetical protein